MFYMALGHVVAVSAQEVEPATKPPVISIGSDALTQWHRWPYLRNVVLDEQGTGILWFVRHNHWRDEVFYEYFWERQFPQQPTMFSIRTDRYKYISYGAWATDELFDLQEDPQETRNLIGEEEHQPLVRKMRDRLCDKIESMNGIAIEIERPNDWWEARRLSRPAEKRRTGDRRESALETVRGVRLLDSYRIAQVMGQSRGDRLVPSTP